MAVSDESFLGKRIDIAGDELTGDETAAILSKAIGKPVKYESFPTDKMRSQNPDLAIMLKWQEKTIAPQTRKVCAKIILM